MYGFLNLLTKISFNIPNATRWNNIQHEIVFLCFVLDFSAI